MPALTWELPPRKGQTAFNLRRWNELLADPELNRFDGRIEFSKFCPRFPLQIELR
jgi:hypothetical protein